MNALPIGAKSAHDVSYMGSITTVNNDND